MSGWCDKHGEIQLCGFCDNEESVAEIARLEGELKDERARCEYYYNEVKHLRELLNEGGE